MAALLLLASCGLPNPYEIQSELAPPHSVSARYDGEKLVLSITGYHPRLSTPDFTGYNIYWDRIATAQTILQRFAYADNLFKPSVSARPADGMQTVTVSLSQWWWSNTVTGVLTRENFVAHDSYFLIVTAWASRSRSESGYYGIAEVRIPRWLTNQSNYQGVTFTNEGPNFSITADSVVPQNGSRIQGVGWAEAWTNVFGAPSSGYGLAPLPLMFSNVYYLTSYTDRTNYGKLWIYDRQGTNLRFHWAYLQSSTLL